MSNLHTVTYSVNSNHTSITATDVNTREIQTFSKGDIMEFEVNASKVFFYIERIYSFSACKTILLVGLLWNLNQWEKEKELHLNFDIQWEKVSFDVKLPWNVQNELDKILQTSYVQKSNYSQSPYMSYTPNQPTVSKKELIEQFNTNTTPFKTPLQVKLQDCTMVYNKNDTITIQTSRQPEKFRVIEFEKVNTNDIMISGYFNDSKTPETFFIDISNTKGNVLNQYRNQIGTILSDKIKCKEISKIIYNGNLKKDKDGNIDEIDYMKEAFKNNDEFGKKIKNGTRINDTTIKLDDTQCIHSLPYDSSGNKTLDLYQRASKYNIGPTLFKYFTVHKDIKLDPIRQYLILDYLKPIHYNYDFDSVQLLTKKIANSNLRFHPYFHYKMLGIDKENNLKVMFWDIINLYEKLNRIVVNPDNDVRIKAMIKTFRGNHGGKKTKIQRKTQKKTRRN